MAQSPGVDIRMFARKIREKAKEGPRPGDFVQRASIEDKFTEQATVRLLWGPHLNGYQ